MFADDVLLFCKVDVASFQALWAQFEKISTAFGLEANPTKCEIYFAGVSIDV